MVAIAVVLDADDWALVHGSCAASSRFLMPQAPGVAADYASLARAIDHQVFTALGMKAADDD